MNVLFLSLMQYSTINERDIYTDLLREFIRNGHHVSILSPTEGSETLIAEENSTIYRVPTGKIEKASFLQKGINTILIEYRFISAIKKHLSHVRFDLVLYPTPPITFVGAVQYVKERDKAKTYLMLKDIFPQNAVDIGIMSNRGVKGMIYRFFRRKERRLYAVSDHIGCMSQANVDYIVENHPELNPKKVGICPNCIEIMDKSVNVETRNAIRKKYGIPEDRIVFVYGGNLGRPQGVPFLVECLKTQKKNNQIYFLVVGDGTEYPVLERYSLTGDQDNFKLMQRLPKEDYDTLVGACDVGMLFLDHRFTIPNFPSRLLSYMQAKLPVLACTDPNTDVGKVIIEGGFGWWCESNSTDTYQETIEAILRSDLPAMGKKGEEYLLQHYTEKNGYRAIMDSFKAFGKDN